MKKIIIPTFLVILTYGCAIEEKVDPRLEGEWVSDKERTLKEIGKNSSLSNSI